MPWEIFCGVGAGAGGLGRLHPAGVFAERHWACSAKADLLAPGRPALLAWVIRVRPPYNCRHTYATIGLMSGLNPSFIAQQLGHSVHMLLTTSARWINSSSDWSELETLQLGIKMVSAAISAT